MRILVASDFSECSDRALARAVDLARSSGAAIEIVHVVDFALLEFPASLAIYDADGGSSYLGYAEAALAERCERVRGAGVPCEARTLGGAAPVEIVRRAADVRADLIVVGTHGRTGLAHAFLGSVAERVVQHASCPVLSVPAAWAA